MILKPRLDQNKRVLQIPLFNTFFICLFSLRWKFQFTNRFTYDVQGKGYPQGPMKKKYSLKKFLNLKGFHIFKSCFSQVLLIIQSLHFSTLLGVGKQLKPQVSWDFFVCRVIDIDIKGALRKYFKIRFLTWERTGIGLYQKREKIDESSFLL